MEFVMSILVLVAVLSLVAAFLALRKGAPMRRVLLLIGLALVFALNVAIWTVPDGSGEAPLGRAPVVE